VSGEFKPHSVNEKGSQTSRCRIEDVDRGKAEGQVYTNHTNEYGLVDALQRLPGWLLGRKAGIWGASVYFWWKTKRIQL